jgi:hypothetical protein
MRTALRVKFPDHQEKYREFSQFRPPTGRLAAEKALLSFGFLSEFPTKRNRNIERRTGNYFAGTGNFLQTTGKPVRSKSGKKSRLITAFGVFGSHRGRIGAPLVVRQSRVRDEDPQRDQGDLPRKAFLTRTA